MSPYMAYMDPMGLFDPQTPQLSTIWSDGPMDAESMQESGMQKRTSLCAEHPRFDAVLNCSKQQNKHKKLVGGWATPLKNMSSSIGMMTFPIYGKIKNGNQTTNQLGMIYSSRKNTLCNPGSHNLFVTPFFHQTRLVFFPHFERGKGWITSPTTLMDRPRAQVIWAIASLMVQCAPPPSGKLMCEAN